MSDLPEHLVETRRSLHGVAELLLAGPQHRRSETIRLAVTPTGFRTVADPMMALDGEVLVIGDKRVELDGHTFAHVADKNDFTAAAPFDVYEEGPDSDPRRKIRLDQESVQLVVSALVAGDAALRTFAPDQEPVLWPEHFDVSVTVDSATYGVSAGDDEIAVPYAYVAPFEKPAGEFWSFSFGAALPVPATDAVGALVDFFIAGRTTLGG